MTIVIADEVNALRDEILKSNPNLMFTPHDRVSWGNQENNHYKVFYQDEPEIEVGSIGYCKSEKRWWVASQYNPTGRWVSSAGQTANASINMRNIVKIAKTALIFPTLGQYSANNYINGMERHINNVKHQHFYDIHNNTFGMPEEVHADLFKLHEMGYKALSPHLRQAIKYMVENKEEHQRTQKYEPIYYHVWIKNSSVSYQKYQQYKEVDVVKQVKTKAELPQHILDKIVILDLMEIDNEVHDGIGCKEKHNFYSVFE